MFSRREQRNLWARLRNAVWPDMGWRRAGKYLYYRIVRLPGTPYSIGAGFACGAAISFTPFPGLHFLIGVVWAWLIRANIVANFFGTFIGNAWTFPFIWVMTYNIGLWLSPALGLGFQKDGAPQNTVDFLAVFDNLLTAFWNWDVALFVESVLPVWLPMLAGSIPVAALVWLVCFFPLRAGVHYYQHHHRGRLQNGGGHVTTKNE